MRFVLAMEVLEISAVDSELDYDEFPPEGLCCPVRRCKCVLYFLNVADFKRHLFSQYTYAVYGDV